MIDSNAALASDCSEGKCHTCLYISESKVQISQYRDIWGHFPCKKEYVAQEKHDKPQPLLNKTDVSFFAPYINRAFFLT